MRVAFFHGLESPSVSDKSEFLQENFEEAYCPPMNYKNPKLFEEVYQEIKRRRIEVLMGSSMGGWFAYCYSTLTGLPTIIFNPALQGRSFDPIVRLGEKIAPEHRIILGKNDKVILPERTIDWLSVNKVENYHIYFVESEHRVPIEIFSKWVNLFTK